MLCRKYFVCKKKLYIYFSYDFGIASLINNFTGWGKAPTSLARSCPCKSIQSECRKKCLHFFLIEDNSTREQMF